MDKDLRGVLIKPEAPPPLVLGVKLWAAAIPQPELGHAQLLARLAEAEAQVTCSVFLRIRESLALS